MTLSHLKLGIMQWILLISFFLIYLLSFATYQKYYRIELDGIFILTNILMILFFKFRTVIRISDLIALSGGAFVLAYLVNSNLPKLSIVASIVEPILLFVFVAILITRLSINLRQTEFINLVSSCFIVAICLKYALSQILLLNSRPHFLTENNFEVIVLVWLSFYHQNQKLRLLSFFSVLLSLSKSGIISAIVIYIGRKFVQGEILQKLTITFVCLITVSIFFYYLYGSDLITTIDRIKILSNFVANSDIRSLLFPKLHIAELPTGVCEIFSWSNKVERDDEALVCFSNVLTIGNIKVIWDFGILGLFALVLGYYYLLRSLHIAKLAILTFLLAVFLNGMSVSGFGNGFIIPLMIWVVANKDRLRDPTKFKD